MTLGYFSPPFFFFFSPILCAFSGFFYAVYEPLPFGKRLFGKHRGFSFPA